VARVEANTAPESVLAAMKDLGPEVAAQIVATRSQRPFRDWADLVGRVIGLRAAGPAMRASMGGLTVDGQALEGAGPPAGYLP
jgi:competence protein ComEA